MDVNVFNICKQQGYTSQSTEKELPDDKTYLTLY